MMVRTHAGGNGAAAAIEGSTGRPARMCLGLGVVGMFRMHGRRAKAPVPANPRPRADPHPFLSSSASYSYSHKPTTPSLLSAFLAEP